MADEGRNVVTMMLPEGIEILRQRQEQESATPSQLDDVEYYEEYEEELKKVTQQTKPTAGKSDRKLPHPYSIDLWNGSPILPSFEDYEFDNSS
jgi:hypothetical protein